MKLILIILIPAIFALGLALSLTACGDPAPVGPIAMPLPSAYMAVPTPIVPVAATPSPSPTATPVPTPEPTVAPPVIPSWELALEEFLLEFLPIFTPGTRERNEWSEWEVGGWRQFVRGQADGFYIADPATGQRVSADTAPYIWSHRFAGEHESALYIAAGFYLHDINGDGVPELLIRWTTPDGYFEGVRLFRYVDGAYVAARVTIRTFERNEAVDTPWLFWADISGGAELLARDSRGRVLTLGIGGAGGFGTWAYTLNMDDTGVRLTPAFNIRFDSGMYGPELDLFVDAAFAGEAGHLSQIGQEDALFVPWEWAHGEGDITPVPIPIMPNIAVAPFPRMYNLERRLTESITSQLIAEGRIVR